MNLFRQIINRLRPTIRLKLTNKQFQRKCKLKNARRVTKKGFARNAGNTDQKVVGPVEAKRTNKKTSNKQQEHEQVDQIRPGVPRGTLADMYWVTYIYVAAEFRLQALATARRNVKACQTSRV